MRRAVRVLLIAALVSGFSIAGISPGHALSASSRIPWVGGSWYLQGTNYPWHNYGADFGSNAWGASGVSNPASHTVVDADFAAMAAEGVHSVRWWVFSDARAGITFDGGGMPTGIDSTVFPDLDAALQIAAKYKIYLNLVLLDFTFMENATIVSGVQLGGHAAVINTAAGQLALINNVFVPVFKRYGSNPMIISWEVMNEPEWAITEDGAVNGLVSQPSSLANFQGFTKAVASAVHANTKSYVTVGEAAMKWDQQWMGLGLDFYQIHFYDWMQPYPITNLYGATAASLSLDAPVVVGEFAAANSTTATLQQYLDTWFNNGYAGAWSWSYAGVDTNGTPSPGVMTSWAASHASAINIAPAGPPPSGVPAYDHIVTILMENTPYSSIIGNASAPYINQLAGTGAVAGNYSATDHPSLPNYAELTSGQSFPNASSDCDPSASCQSTALNIIDRVVGSGRTWHSYQESMGAPCGKLTSGNYAPKHNPFVYYTDISAASCSANVVDYSKLATDFATTASTPNYAFVTPNLCNDMHDCSIQTGDTWLSNNVPTVLTSPAFTTQKSLLVVVWDEDDGTGTNQVAWIGVGYGVKTNFVSAVAYDHYSYLKTIEAAWGLASLTSTDGSASAMTDVFGAGVPPLTATAGGSPTSGSVPLTVNFTGSGSGGTAPYSFSWNFGDGSSLSTNQNPSHVYSSAGSYTARLTVTDSAARTASASAPAVTVNSAALAVTAAASPRAGDAPLSVTLNAGPSGGTLPYVYSWDFGDGSAFATSRNPTHIYRVAGAFVAQVTLTDAVSSSVRASVTVTVAPTLAAIAGASPTSGTAPLNVNLTGTATGGKPPFSYGWDFGDGSALSTSPNPTHVYASAGTYTATLGITDANGVTVTATAPAVHVIAPAPCTVPTLVASPAGYPQVTGTPVTLTATTTCGAPPLYQFWVKTPDGRWHMTRDYDAANTYTWTSLNTQGGGYTLEVDVKNSGSPVAYERYTDIPYSLSACNIPTLSTGAAGSPYPSGKGAITLTATGSCSGGTQFEFWYRDTRNAWHIIGTGYGSSTTATWNADYTPGSYILEVSIRPVGSTASYDTYFDVPFTLSGCGLPGLTPDKASPQAAGTQVTWTATVTCPGIPQYQFWVRTPAGVWSIAQPYGANTFVWSSPASAGSYMVEVDVRSSGAIEDPYDSYTDVAYSLGSLGGACTTPSLSTGAATSPYPSGKGAITLTATGSCPGGTEFEFYYRDLSNAWHIIGSGYSSSPTATWNADYRLGTYLLEADLRPAGSTVSYVTYFDLPFSLSGCGAPTLTPDKASPQTHGTQVTWTAAVTCSGTAQYEFYVRSPAGVWTIIQPWGPSNTFVWTAPTAGAYVVEVDARNNGALEDPYDTYIDIPYRLT